MNVKAAAVAISAACFLSACLSAKKPTTPPVEAQFATAEAQSSVQKYVVLDSHTFVYNANRRRVELKGVPCTVKGNGFTVSYTTPANLRLPVYGPNTSDLSMTCQYEGDERFKNIEVRNLTAESISNAGASGGFIGSLVATGIAAGRGNRANDEYTYSTPSMFLNEKAKR